LDRGASDQQRLARRFVALEQRLTATASDLPATEVSAAERLTAALAEAASRNPAEKMRLAADDLSANRPARAAAAQQQAADDLEAIAARLHGEAGGSPAASVSARLADLQTRQAALAQAFAAADAAQGALGDLAARQAALQRQAQGMASALPASMQDALSRAAGAMAAASQAARAGRRPQAAEQAQQAAERLRELVERPEMPSSGADPTVRLQQRVLQLKEAQQALLEDTRRGSSEARALASRQAELRGLTRGLAGTTASSPVLQYSLEQVAAAMGRAVDWLQAGRRDQPTLDAQQEAVDRLTALATALEREQPPAGQPGAPPGAPPPPGGANPRAAAADPMLLAELKLLRQWQDQVREEFARLTAAGETGAPQPVDPTALTRVRDEQARLAELAEEISARAAARNPPATEPSEDSPTTEDNPASGEER
jgi:hypothetical protein